MPRHTQRREERLPLPTLAQTSSTSHCPSARDNNRHRRSNLDVGSDAAAWNQTLRGDTRGSELGALLPDLVLRVRFYARLAIDFLEADVFCASHLLDEAGQQV